MSNDMKIPKNGMEFILSLDEVCCFQSQERGPGRASKSELRRIIDQGGLHVNGAPIKSKDKLPHPITNVVLFPKSKKKRTTLL